MAEYSSIALCHAMPCLPCLACPVAVIIIVIVIVFVIVTVVLIIFVVAVVIVSTGNLKSHQYQGRLNHAMALGTPGTVFDFPHAGSDVLRAPLAVSLRYFVLEPRALHLQTSKPKPNRQSAQRQYKHQQQITLPVVASVHPS